VKTVDDGIEIARAAELGAGLWIWPELQLVRRDAEPDLARRPGEVFELDALRVLVAPLLHIAEHVADKQRQVDRLADPVFRVLEEAVAVNPTRARRLECLDARVGVFGAVDDMRVVDAGRDACVQRLEQPDIVADIDVLRLIEG
jgi:hypothetical protein